MQLCIYALISLKIKQFTVHNNTKVFFYQDLKDKLRKTDSMYFKPIYVHISPEVHKWTLRCIERNLDMQFECQ